MEDLFPPGRKGVLFLFKMLPRVQRHIVKFLKKKGRSPDSTCVPLPLTRKGGGRMRGVKTSSGWKGRGRCLQAVEACTKVLAKDRKKKIVCESGLLSVSIFYTYSQNVSEEKRNSGTCHCQIHATVMARN